MATPLGEIRDFLDSYLRAFEAFDLEGIIRHFVFPAYFAGDGPHVVLTPVPDETTCRRNIGTILDLHRKLGVQSSRVLEFGVLELSAKLVVFNLHLEVRGAEARPLYDFRGAYTLSLGGGEWKLAAIAHNQVPRLMDCLQARTAALLQP